MSDWRIDQQAGIAQERKDIDAFDQALDALVSLSGPVARFGDGNCGHILLELKKRLTAAGLYTEPERGQYKSKKEIISNKLRTQVFERDMFRCLRCGTHIDLRADHVVPESVGGKATLDNLQTLCLPCNSWKGTKTIDYRGGVA